MDRCIRYLRALGAFYLRLVGRPLDIYQYLEPLLNDYRKLKMRGLGGTDPSHTREPAGSMRGLMNLSVVRVRVPGWKIVHMDEFIDELLTGDYSCDVALPHLIKRHLLEDQKLLPPRMSGLDDDDQELLEEEMEEEMEVEQPVEEEEEEGGEAGLEEEEGGERAKRDKARDGEEETNGHADGDGHRKRERSDRDDERVSGGSGSEGPVMGMR